MTQQVDTIIVGAGLSGLTVAHKLKTQGTKHRFLVLEKSSSPGGVIRTHRENGYISEIGPHGFLDNCEESKAILKETGLDRECIKAPLIEFVRYVYLRGQLRLIPQTPIKILKAPLISWRDKLRVLAELWTPPLEGEPTVAKWVNHRFGPALLPFADAVFTGTYAGDMNRLVIDAVMPGVRKIEMEHGSVIRGLLAKAREAKKSGKKRGGMPAMTSFPQGMQRLPEKLSDYLQEGTDVLYNCGAQAIAHTHDGWRVDTTKGTFSADNLILALPTNAALSLLKTIANDMPLNSIAETQLATIAFGFDKGAQLPPGFGFLTPEQEGRFALGALFSSNMFPGRAPAGHILFETLVGGRRHPEHLELDDDTLVEKSLKDVKEILKLSGDPAYIRVMRSWGGIPQLEHRYPQLLQWRDALVQRYPGLHVCGFGWEGIGLNDMMKTATRTAKTILAGGEGKREKAAVKGVYF